MSIIAVYALEAPPLSYEHAIFLAGPTPRDPLTPSWRPEALRILEDMGYNGVVFVPEPRSGVWATDYMDQASWEQRCIKMSDTTVFWVPRNMRSMPGLTTNVEFGRKVDQYNLVFGAPEEAEKVRYLEWLGGEATQGNFVRHYTLVDTLRAAIYAAPRALRSGGERFVPSQIFNTPAFQEWYRSLWECGNRLDYAEVLWKFVIHKPNITFAFALKVHVWVEAEQRLKDNEFILSRPDTFMTVLYRRPDSGDSLDTEIVLIREFRSTVRNVSGYVYEVPGGSSFKPGKSPLEVASSEVREECGIEIEPARFYPVESRQVSATFSTHCAHVFACELTDEEIVEARQNTEPHGVENEDERTFVEVRTLREIMGRHDVEVDWSTLGIICDVVLDPELRS